MSKYDLYFSSVDESDGESCVTFGSFYGTTSGAVVITAEPFTLNVGSAVGTGVRAGGRLVAVLSPLVLEIVQDWNPGDTTVKVRLVESSVNTKGVGDSVASGELIFAAGGVAVDLVIDLRSAPSGTYSYLIGGHASVQGATTNGVVGAGMTITDDLRRDYTDPNTGVAQNKVMSKVGIKTAMANQKTPITCLMQAQLDSGKRHYVRYWGDGSFNVEGKIYNPRIFALRYDPELSFGVTGDGASSMDSTSGANLSLELSTDDFSGMKDESVYVVAGQGAGSNSDFGSANLLAYVDNQLYPFLTACTAPGTGISAFQTGETVSGSGLLTATGKSLNNTTPNPSAYLALSSTGSATVSYKNVLFGAFYCPAVQQANSGLSSSNSSPAVLPTTYTDLVAPSPAVVSKQQNIFMTNGISGRVNSVTGSATSYSVRSSFPSPDGTSRDEAVLPVGFRNTSWIPFHVAEVPRGSKVLATQLKADATTSASTGAFTVAPAVCAASDVAEYASGKRREILAILDTQIAHTQWSTFGSSGWQALIDYNLSRFDEVTELSINGDRVNLYDGTVPFVANSNQFSPAIVSGGLQVFVYPKSGAPDLSDPDVSVALTVPMRFSMLGSDVCRGGYSAEDELPFEPRLLSSPSVRRSMQQGVSIGSVQINNADGKYDQDIVRRAWPGRRARVYAGDPDVAKSLIDYDLIFDGEMGLPSGGADSFSVKLVPTDLPLSASMDLGDVTEFVGTADANEYTQTSKLPVVYGNVLRTEAVRVSDRTGTSSRYAAMFGKQSFTPTKAYLNSSDPSVAFTIPTDNDNSDVAIADSVISGGAPANRLSTVFLDGKGLPYYHAGEICLDIIERFSSIPLSSVNVDSFYEIDSIYALKLKSGNYRYRGVSAEMGIVIPADQTVGEALNMVLSTVGGSLIVPADGKLSAAFKNSSLNNQLGILPGEAESWCTFHGQANALVGSHPGFANIPFATKFKVQSGPARTASGVVVFPDDGTYAFETLAVAGSFNNPNNLKIEMTLPGSTTRTTLWPPPGQDSGAVPIDTNYPVENTWKWKMITALIEVPEGYSGTGRIYVSPRIATTQASEIDVYLDQTRLVSVTKITDSNANYKSLRVLPVQYSSVASQFNVNPLRPQAAPTAVATMKPDSVLPAEAAGNRLTLPGSMVDAESSLGVATFVAEAESVQTVACTFGVIGLSAPPRAGDYLHVEMSRISKFNYPSKIWRISEVSQKSASSGTYEVTAYRSAVARNDIFED